MKDKKMEFETLDIDQSELLAKYDTEARFRKLYRNSIPGMIVFLVCVGLSLFHLYTAWQGSLVTLMQRAVHTSVVLGLVFLLYPFSAKSRKDKPTIIDWILATLSIILGAYIIFNYNGIVLRAGMPNTTDVVFGGMAILIVLEGGRRIVGKEITILAILFLAYAYFGRGFPGMMAHRGYS